MEDYWCSGLEFKKIGWLNSPGQESVTQEECTWRYQSAWRSLCKISTESEFFFLSVIFSQKKDMIHGSLMSRALIWGAKSKAPGFSHYTGNIQLPHSRIVKAANHKEWSVRAFSSFLLRVYKGVVSLSGSMTSDDKKER